MRDDKYRDQREPWSSDERACGHVVDVDPVAPTLSRVARGRRSNGKQGLLGPTTGTFYDRDDAQPERLSRRRRFRPEVVVVVIATVFIAGALIKPWAGPLLTPSPTPSGLAAKADPSASYPDMPPTDYRFPFFYPSSLAPSEVLGTPEWSAVDWSVLGATDEHSGWGFTAALMPGPSANVAAPTTTWVDAGSPPAYASVPLVRGRYAYAIAVTWPADVNVTGLEFVYLAPPRSPPYAPPAGFSPNTQVTPLPALGISSPSTEPRAIATAPARSESVSTPMASGSFWIPPSEASPTGVASSVDAAWRSNPWPWPYGSYLVTVTSDRGSTHIVLDLLLT